MVIEFITNNGAVHCIAKTPEITLDNDGFPGLLWTLENSANDVYFNNWWTNHNEVRQVRVDGEQKSARISKSIAFETGYNGKLDTEHIFYCFDFS